MVKITLLLSVLSIVSIVQSHSLVVNYYTDANCTILSRATASPEGCSVYPLPSNQNAKGSSDVSFDGDIATVALYNGGTCSGTSKTSNSYNTTGQCISANGSFYRAGENTTFSVNPGPSDQITESWGGSTCGAGYVSVSVTYGQGCNQTACALSGEIYTKGVCQTTGVYALKHGTEPSSAAATRVISLILVFGIVAVLF
ncbi:hypothetical protein PROFUN_00310 [Planoprotostelium fungivorum]|uniref:Uncharacterized protein n=1 Tax=Planoprotostelium fungivorum TaxID=1890364 RepID=A0A2P6NY29_9EUKA|nr:hypothetical protein PROFUN_00310 [Planoprotostelium fungivorum]